ncbi:MAG: glycosyltransferase [Proteobacteria bacterium]|nr:glycosyltransferase [Pseudomonadota bacterium]
MPWSPDSIPPERQEPQRILVFEPEAEGHTLEWLDAIVQLAVAERTDVTLWLVVAERLCEPLARQIPATDRDRIRIVPLPAAEARRCIGRPLARSGFWRWWTMRKYLRKTGARHGFFLSIDLLTLPLAFRLGVGGSSLSGILFRPSVHYREIGPYRPSFGDRLRDLQKTVLYPLMLRNPAVERVLSLDPFFPPYAHAHYQYGKKVMALPDPIHLPVAPAASDNSGDFVPTGRTGFLLFGYIAERKGPLAVLDALMLLPSEITSRIAVLFAGKVDPALRERLDRRIDALVRTRPDLWFKIDDRRLDKDELAALVRRSDVILAPYQRFVGSSGVLLWAAVNGRPVLAQEYGLVGRFTREHRLGISVDSSDPTQLAAEIARMVEQGPATFFDRSAAARFVAAQTPHRFASLVLSV